MLSIIFVIPAAAGRLLWRSFDSFRKSALIDDVYDLGYIAPWLESIDRSVYDGAYIDASLLIDTCGESRLQRLQGRLHIYRSTFTLVNRQTDGWWFRAFISISTQRATRQVVITRRPAGW